MHAAASSSNVPDVHSLATSWRQRAAALRAWAAADVAAHVWESAAAELTASLDAEAGELLTLEEAARRSGFSADGLRRMVRNNKLRAERRGRRLYFRAGDLPQKPTREPPAGIDRPQREGYDPLADARRVARKRATGD